MKYFIIMTLFLALPSLGQIKSQRLFDMEWDEVPGATQYEIEMLLNGKTIIRKVTAKASWSGEIKPGQYTYRLRAFDQRKVPGPWSDLEPLTVYLTPVKLLAPNTDQNKILAKAGENHEVTFSWQSVPLATRYRVEIRSLTGGDQKQIEVEGDTILQINLPVGKRYSWMVTPFGESSELIGDPEVREISEFELIGPPLEKAKLEAPDTEYVRQIKWKPSRLASHELVKIFKKKESGGWELVTESQVKDGEYPIPLSWPGGRYQLQVKSQAELYQDSEVAAITFLLHSGDRSEQAQYNAELRKSIDGFKGWFGQATYLISQVDYLSTQVHSGFSANTRFSTVAGTGRLGVGYLGAQKEWGFLSSIDLSGMINQQGQNVTYAGAEASALYKTRLTERDEVRFKLGGYYKQLPFALVDVSTLKVNQYSNLSSQGLFAGTEYWFSLTPKLGFQAHVYLYRDAAVQAPLVTRSAVAESDQVGILGSYKLTKRQTGLMGLAYRQDRASFDALDSGGRIIGANIIEIRGLFLNFVLEHEF